jgi:predicted dehydrogenase
VFVDACAAGVKGIFCEKPMATTLDDADRMIAAAERSGTRVLVDHLRRFDAFYRQAKYLLDAGTIGPLVRVVGTMGGERAMLFRNGTHLVDTIDYLVGSEPRWVMAELDRADADYGPLYRGSGGRDASTEPGGSAIVEFASGVRAFYNGSKAAFSKGPQGATGSYFEIDLQGESGRIVIGDLLAELWTVGVGGGLARQPLPQTFEMKAPMVTAIEELIGLIETDGDGTASPRDARRTLEVLLGMLTSADRNGAKVQFPLPVPVTA